MLTLIATPIGNLGDFSRRAVETLQVSDLILCEDTRHSGTLLKEYNVSRPLQSFHKFNEAEKEEELIALLREGKQISLISDAGTPGINDPGARLVARCREEGIEVTAVPGPCALINALVLSGFSTDRFQFIGFLEKKSGALTRQFAEILHFPGTSIAYESPHRLLKSLQRFAELAPDAPMAICRELTKRHEEVDRGSAGELAARWAERQVKGEVVVLFGHHPLPWLHEEPAEHVAEVAQLFDLPRKEAAKLVAELRGISKKELYIKKDEEEGSHD